ncbi:MAG TPA: guanylate kinase, partial [Taishania sp.]|nr:guanylate kinase [Taishania sp.]
EVYTDNFYGTLKSELERIWAKGHCVIFDVDVIGGLNLKKILGDSALAVFVQPPSVEVLKERLKSRSTETEEKINMRISKAEYELSFSNQFDQIILNEHLETACNEALKIVTDFIKQ